MSWKNPFDGEPYLVSIQVRNQVWVSRLVAAMAADGVLLRLEIQPFKSPSLTSPMRESFEGL